jgi:hypothetical protein
MFLPESYSRGIERCDQCEAKSTHFIWVPSTSCDEHYREDDPDVDGCVVMSLDEAIACEVLET